MEETSGLNYKVFMSCLEIEVLHRAVGNVRFVGSCHNTFEVLEKHAILQDRA